MIDLYPLGRREPSDWKHVERYGIAAVQPQTVSRVEQFLQLPPVRFREFYNQLNEGACVAVGLSWAETIYNRIVGNIPRYDWKWLYAVAQAIDEWDDTPPESGTSVRAGCDVLRLTGHRRIVRGVSHAPNLQDGIAANRWATNVDEIRTALATGNPVAVGVNWYRNFDKPVEKLNGEYWIGQGDLGSIRGGHCVCIYAASDKRQAVKIVNNWGMSYPLVWLPYATLQRLLDEYGEATLITDR